MEYTTPGVYVEEISPFPPSVAEVATAIPAFIGYTEKAVKNGEALFNKPTRIMSLLEYRELFGGEYAFVPGNLTVVVDPANGHAVSSVSVSKRFYMYESMRLFFDNGGGPCYIVSVGNYSSNIAIGDGLDPAKQPGFKVGLKALEKYDEPTIILFPDAQLLTSEGDLHALQQAALAQCAKLQDRVAIFDLKDRPGDLATRVDNFRNKIGNNNLKYGAAYLPWLVSGYPKRVGFELLASNVKDKNNNAVNLTTLTSDSELNALVIGAVTAIRDKAALKNKIGALKPNDSPALKDCYASLRNEVHASTEATAQDKIKALVGYVRSVAVDIPSWNGAITGANLKRDLKAYATGKLKGVVEPLIKLEKNDSVQAQTNKQDADIGTAYGANAYDGTGWLSAQAANIPQSANAYDKDAQNNALGTRDTALAIAKDLDAVFAGVDAFIEEVVQAASTHAETAQKTLYERYTIVGNIVEHIKRELSRVPPSAAVAGVYAFVDSSRGVWKAPANVSLNRVASPSEAIDDVTQEKLNVDTVGGKSINAIRFFTGRGTIVWGARTLAGNDNEWRYINVRRFFNLVEESVKKSTAWAVFEPNAAPLWIKVKGMIENYLTLKWRDGALAGARPNDAFYVKVGLGQTMTAQDILEGRLNVEIGMAVVRPAEFIVLKFSHIMQKS